MPNMTIIEINQTKCLIKQKPVIIRPKRILMGVTILAKG